METKKDLTPFAPCGTYCGECEAYKAKDDPKLMEYLLSRGFKQETLPCPGCREVKGKCPAIGKTCETYLCIQEHQVDFCFECGEFPCAKLNPASDRANVLPHNLKVYNLCCIEHQGLDKLVEEISEIRKRYFKGKMHIGIGPVVEE